MVLSPSRGWGHSRGRGPGGRPPDTSQRALLVQPRRRERRADHFPPVQPAGPQGRADCFARNRGPWSRKLLSEMTHDIFSVIFCSRCFFLSTIHYKILSPKSRSSESASRAGTRRSSTTWPGSTSQSSAPSSSARGWSNKFHWATMSFPYNRGMLSNKCRMPSFHKTTHISYEETFPGVFTWYTYKVY